MIKKQFTVKEENQWEGETFNYVLMLTEDELDCIKTKIEDLGEGNLTIKSSSWSCDDVFKMNRMSSNCYMAFIGFYELKDGALERWIEFGDCFYKGVGLQRVDSLKS